MTACLTDLPSPRTGTVTMAQCLLLSGLGHSASQAGPTHLAQHLLSQALPSPVGSAAGPRAAPLCPIWRTWPCQGPWTLARELLTELSSLHLVNTDEEGKLGSLLAHGPGGTACQAQCPGCWLS